MRKCLTLLALLLALTACSPVVTASPAPTPFPTFAPPAAPDCQAVAMEPTPGPEIPSLFPVVSDTDHVSGAETAFVTVVEYCDFQAQNCALLAETLTRLRQQYPEDLRVVYRHFPLAFNDKSQLAARAAEAAGSQDRFWQLHDRLLSLQPAWADLDESRFRVWLQDQAVDLGLDPAQFVADLDNADLQAQVQQAAEFGLQTGLPGVPFLLINGQMYFGPIDYLSLDQIMRLTLIGQRQYTACPEMTIDPDKQYIARLLTEKGEIVILLYADKAPLTVNAFIFLARQGWYDGITFHRVIPGFMAQTGDPSGTGLGGPGYLLRNEIDPGLSYDRPGVVGMANAGPDTNGSQFFITYAPVTRLDGDYTIFGQVLSGMDVLTQLTPRDPQANPTAPPGDLLISVTIQER